MSLRIKLLAVVVSLMPVSVSADPYLLMAEEAGCFWCARWNAEIAEVYPKTPEGRSAPLVRYDIHDGAPADVTLARRVHYTPTFILVDAGREVGRIEGYPGEDFFWGLLSEILTNAGHPPDANG